MIRIVKLTIKTESIEDFREFFVNNKSKILSNEGIISLKLIQSIHDNRIFSTISEWQSSKYLEIYRGSDLFKNIWSQVKRWFDDIPIADSFEEIG